MSSQIDREVERRDERAGTHRHPFPDALVSFGSGGDVQGHVLSVYAHSLFGGDSERVDPPGNFTASVPDRFAGFDGQRLSQFLLALGQTADNVVQDRRPGERRHPPTRFLRLDRSRDGPVDGCCVRQCHARGNLTGVLVRHRQVGIGSDRFAG